MTQTDETATETADETTGPAGPGGRGDADATPDPEVDHPDTESTDDEVFPLAYVQKLRHEAAEHRRRASDRDDLAQRLHGALVAATGRLADPADLAFDENHLTDPEALTAALDDLLARKPHFATRRIVGDVGQGATQVDTPVDLAGLLRRNAT